MQYASVAVYRDLRHAALECLGFLSYLWSFRLFGKSYVVERWPGALDLASATRVAIFNHYDRQGVVHDFQRHYVRQLEAAGFAIVFVSNAPRLAPATIDWLTPRCALILRRTNAGKDFGAYKDAIQEIPELARLDRLLLANDSVYGPFHDLAGIVDRMDGEIADVWCITDSWEYRYHLQSYFLLFGRRALENPAFRQFWGSLRYVQNKNWLIFRYEIGLSRRLMSAGLRCRALFAYRDCANAVIEAVQGGRILDNEALSSVQKKFIAAMFGAINAGRPLNGTHFFWDYLIGAMGCPFVKRELLRDNPAGIPFLTYWPKVIQGASGYDTDMILRHLELTLRDRSI
ncbi:MAG: polysaccharide biosynthesis-like protein [Alphaproteobacteria bacterium]|nr:polysaccharide biosynthesis-like protein [Alphaproteobacteria bacterium]